MTEPLLGTWDDGSVICNFSPESTLSLIKTLCAVQMPRSCINIIEYDGVPLPSAQGTQRAEREQQLAAQRVLNVLMDIFYMATIAPLLS